jgi:hypothetical protein
MFKGLYCTTEAEGFRKKISGVSLKLILNNNISPSFPWLWLKEGALIISISSKKHQGIIRSGWDGNKTLLIRISNMISSLNKSTLSQEGRPTLFKFPCEYDWKNEWSWRKCHWGKGSVGMAHQKLPTTGLIRQVPWLTQLGRYECWVTKLDNRINFYLMQSNRMEKFNKTLKYSRDYWKIVKIFPN